MTPRERFVDVSVVADRLFVTAHAVRNWIRNGKLRVIKTPSGRYRVPYSELTRLLDQAKESKAT